MFICPTRHTCVRRTFHVQGAVFVQRYLGNPNELNSRNRQLLQKKILAQLANECTTSNLSEDPLPWASHWSLYRLRLIQSRTSHLKYLEFTSIFFFHLNLEILSDLYRWHLKTIFFYEFLYCFTRAACHIQLTDWQYSFHVNLPTDSTASMSNWQLNTSIYLKTS
jgi:hypothetical protein